ncbi:hypothetical protein [Gordonia sp. (in: high G+C Gram-positive bacteria)]|uniref:hypothetical protein n=1 Tax=Gordonia sp. (in: high G+C Gram-positive bacteria) TaxID=84139 RepID=UPI0039E3C6E5
MTGLLTVAAIVVAMGATILALPLMWVSRRVVDDRGFSDTAAEMADRDVVRDYIADTITKQIGKAAGSITGNLARPLAVRYTRSDAFVEDCVDLLDAQHDRLLGPVPAGADPSVMNLDLTKMVSRVAGQVSPLLGTQIKGPILVPVTTTSPALQAGRYEVPGRRIPQWATISLIVGVVAALIALVFSESRTTTLVWLGLGAVLAAIAAWVLGGYAGTRAKAAVGDPNARPLVSSTVDGLVADLRSWAVIVGGGGAALAVIGVIGRIAVAVFGS